MKTETKPAIEQNLLNPEGPVVTAVGGGHGQAAALEAIQTYASRINALVSVADDGGSSGRLTAARGIPPPGDIRRCLLALTPHPSLWSELFAHRFEGGDVDDHSLGNLILTGFTDLFGDFGAAVMCAEAVLGTLGRVIPVADQPVTLCAVVDGKKVNGQGAIARGHGRITDLSIEPAEVEASRAAIDAIYMADQVILGPGSLYTSLIAAMKVRHLAEALNAVSAQKVFVLNLVTQDGETLGMSGSDHLEALRTHAGVEGPGLVIAHRGLLQVPGGHEPVDIDVEAASKFGWRVVYADVAGEDGDWPSHDPVKLGRVLERVAEGNA